MTTDQPETILAAEERSTVSKSKTDTTGKEEPTQKPDKSESGIVYRISDDLYPILTRGRRYSAKRSKSQPESPHEWLWVTQTGIGPNRDSWEIDFIDKELRDCIAKVIAKYNDHTGNNTWQGSQVKLSSPFKAFVFNHAELETEAQSTSLDPTTRKHLQELLQVVDKIHDPVQWKIPKSVDDLWNFRIQYTLLWTLFKPGSLVVGAWNSAQDLQVFQVHDTSYSLKERALHRSNNISTINELVITAWMWDWDGEEIVRTMFELKIPEYFGDKPPAELKCYPIMFYEMEGHRGIEAIRRTSVYQNRRASFLQYALGHRHLELRRYCGDFYGGIPVFQFRREKPDMTMTAMGYRATLWPTVPPRVVKVCMTLGPRSLLY